MSDKTSSNQPSPSNPVFQTPNPTELKSEENQKSMRERLEQEQGGEAEPLSNRVMENDAIETAPESGHAEDQLVDRQIQTANRQAG